MSSDKFAVSAHGHVLITDSVDGVILDQHNSVHPQNMARIIARGLANESNHSIHRIAFGNGGTYIDATGTVNFKTPRDGQLPDVLGWQSRLYNETYTEIVDESSPLLGTGAGAVPSGDGTGAGVRSISAGVQSQVVVTAVLNALEPNAQVQSSTDPTVAVMDDFLFDELALFSPGLPQRATSGYHDIDVGFKTTTSYTYLPPASTFSFEISVDGGPYQWIDVVTPTNALLSLTYSELATLINAQFLTHGVGAIVQLTQPGLSTNGRIRFLSNSAGRTSSVVIRVPNTAETAYATWLFRYLLEGAAGDSSYQSAETPVQGRDGGTEDEPDDQSREQERMLTHLIFSPLLKSADRVWRIQYTLTISVDRTLEEIS